MVADSSAAGMKRIRMRGESSSARDHFGRWPRNHRSQYLWHAYFDQPRQCRAHRSGARASLGALWCQSHRRGAQYRYPPGSERAVELELGSTWDSSANGRQGYTAVSGRVERFDYRLALSGEDFKTAP